jgi:hypothetical protein
MWQNTEWELLTWKIKDRSGSLKHYDSIIHSPIHPTGNQINAETGSIAYKRGPVFCISCIPNTTNITAEDKTRKEN